MLEIVYSDPLVGRYAKIVFDDARTLLGGILVGDASAYATPADAGARDPGDPAALIVPAAGESGIGLDALPDDAEICSCNGVSKGCDPVHGRRRRPRHAA